MTAEFHTGDRVRWNTPQGSTTGRVVKKLTAPIDIKGHHVAASPDDPQYLVESESSGLQAAHHPHALSRA